eukprot:1196036-Prorocentrum_minimum.AAC.3
MMRSGRRRRGHSGRPIDQAVSDPQPLTLSDVIKEYGTGRAAALAAAIPPRVRHTECCIIKFCRAYSAVKRLPPLMGDGSGSPLDRRSPVQIAAHAIVDRFHRERVVQSLNLVGMTNSADRSNVDFEVVSRWEAETTIAQVTVYQHAGCATLSDANEQT